jgi:CRISPR/Cas system-associated endonuclease Cas3-HD
MRESGKAQFSCTHTYTIHIRAHACVRTSIYMYIVREIFEKRRITWSIKRNPLPTYKYY